MRGYIGLERRVKAKGFVLVSPLMVAAWRSTGVAVPARMTQRQQFQTSVWLLGRVRLRCSSRSTGPGHSQCPTREGRDHSRCPTREGRDHSPRYPSLHPVVPMRPSIAASTDQLRQYQPCISHGRTLCSERPPMGVSSLDLGRRPTARGPFSCGAVRLDAFPVCSYSATCGQPPTSYA
jgi:hypothetical protein